jgi:short-subunit dehydrogenase
MLARGDGDVLFVSSVAAWFTSPPLTLYSATKRGVDGFVEGLRREVTPEGVRVHSVNPGPVATEFHARAVHLHPGEGDPGVKPAPGVSPDRVARQVRDELETGRGRTVCVPRVAGVSRLGGQPGVSQVVDLLVRRFARRLEALGPQLADDRAAGFTSAS